MRISCLEYLPCTSKQKYSIKLVDAAVPFSVYPKQWTDRQTSKIIFRPDNCQINQEQNIQESLPNCTISGKDVLNLPPNINIRRGIFTLEYTEGELIRTITFRIPISAESETGLVVVE
ncbi:hypothetical protein C7B62_14065 [Pleurocapsa sp. CCALA 161]|uniref:hypothetical protein n=1 Tax=Pleurocapsa sp. CCALA 161 TaxID=2107688 RepID=UPI000D0533FA|nr:hypothetical protein [Pleurocapsa sp. CCALA 161]PSB09191.1 hypothetical protein C7B62_14065 [Pleurocapsa sp. CCALA 161]